MVSLHPAWEWFRPWLAAAAAASERIACVLCCRTSNQSIINMCRKVEGGKVGGVRMRLKVRYIALELSSRSSVVENFCFQSLDSAAATLPSGPIRSDPQFRRSDQLGVLVGHFYIDGQQRRVSFQPITGCLSYWLCARADLQHQSLSVALTLLTHWAYKENRPRAQVAA